MAPPQCARRERSMGPRRGVQAATGVLVQRWLQLRGPGGAAPEDFLTNFNGF